MTAPELSRPVRLDTLGEGPSALHVEAEEAERAALARRFGLIAIERLAADVELTRKDGEVALAGMLSAAVVQACVASGEPVPAALQCAFSVEFRPEPGADGGDDEVELGEDEMDVIFYEGGAIDVGEAVAETLSLNLDPYPRAPGAEQALRAAGVKNEEEAGAFGALAALRDKLKP